jgi:hypothetical protein
LVPGLLDDPVTRAGVVRHVTLAAETALRLAKDPDYEVRRQVAEHPQLPHDLRDRLAEDPCASVRVDIFARPDTPEPTRERIYFGIQQNSGPLIDVLDADLDEDAFLQSVTDHLAAIELRHLDLAWVTVDPLPHVTSPYVAFRLSAACSRSLPPDTVMQLLNDDESIVRTTMATHAPHLVDLATAERIDREFPTGQEDKLASGRQLRLPSADSSPIRDRSWSEDALSRAPRPRPARRPGGTVSR